MSRKFLLLLGAAFCIRLGWVFFLPLSGVHLYPFMDADGYLKSAAAFHAGSFLDDGRQIERMPLYPALLAFLTQGHLPDLQHPALLLGIIRVWHCLLDVCTVAALYLFVRRKFSTDTALCAAGLYAIYPLALYRLPLMNTEVIQGTALAFWVLGTDRLLDTQTTRDAFLLSLLTALLLFISPALQFLPIFLVIYFFIAYPRARAFPLAAAFLLPILIVTLGWGLRNQAVTGSFFLFDTRGGKEFWLGNNQSVEGRWEGPQQQEWQNQWNQYTQEVLQRGGGPKEVRGFFYKKGLEEIRNHPFGAIPLFVKKFFRFWYVPASERMLSLTIPLQTLYLMFALAGVFFLRKRANAWGLPMGIITYYVSIYTLSYACIRFSLPIMPWVCALGGMGMNCWLERRKNTPQ